jgi:alpha-1,3-rhamnosyltransferase
MISNNPLVTIAVISYNSEKYVIDTLESIKRQTYSNIELIISDDCSSDDTVKLSRKWMDENEKRFRRTIILTTKDNTGIAANVNRALAASNGVWIKAIAADDILFPNCIEDYVNFVSDNPDIHWASSYTVKYKESFKKENRIEGDLVISEEFFTVPVEKQLQIMVRKNVLYAPSLFIKRDMLLALGGYDEKYAVEDYPLYIKALENGYRVFLMPKETVGYRVHPSLSRGNKTIFNYAFQVASRKYRVDLCFKYLSKREKMGLKCIWWLENVFQKYGLNRNNWFLSHFFWNARKLITSIFLSPKSI